MTTISMNWEDMTLVADGHAGGGKPGQDLICAAVSALTQSLLITLQDDHARNRLLVWHSIDEKRGYIKIKVQPASGYKERVRGYFKLVMMGLKNIAEQYPENVRIGEVWSSGNL